MIELNNTINKYSVPLVGDKGRCAILRDYTAEYRTTVYNKTYCIMAVYVQYVTTNVFKQQIVF